jgi:hypothetical protein
MLYLPTPLSGIRVGGWGRGWWWWWWSRISAYFGLDNLECQCLEYLLSNWKTDFVYVLRDKLRSDGDGHITFHVYGISHSEVILLKCGCLGRISQICLLPSRGQSENGMYVCMFIKISKTTCTLVILALDIKQYVKYYFIFSGKKSNGPSRRIIDLTLTYFCLILLIKFSRNSSLQTEISLQQGIP